MSNDSQRLDKWLWCARFFKSRSAAARFCGDGRLRISGQVTNKAHYAVHPGDILTFPLGPHIRVIKIRALAGRRGPPTEARSLYEDLAPPQARPAPAAVPQRDPGAGRPTKADRRAVERLRGSLAASDDDEREEV